MKNFLKKNLGVIIVLGILLLVGSVLGIAIYRVYNQVEPEVIITDNILVDYRGNKENVEVEESVISLATRSFEKNTKLKKITFAGNSKLKSIGHETFKDCTLLTEITLPKGLQVIGKRAFLNCTSLENIVIPEGVTVIEDGAFEGCKNLKSISLPSTLVTLGEGVFNNCDSLEKVSSKSEKFTVKDNILFAEEETILIKYFDKKATAYTVPGTVVEVSSYAFQKTILQVVVINENVKEIGKSIFADCEELVEIVIPFLGSNEESATKLAYFFGENPKNIQKVTILGGKEISSIAFRNCSGLVEVVLPNTIQLIGADAFYGLKKLQTVNIPSSVKRVENRAFGGCSKSLTIVVEKSESSTATWGDWNPDNCTVIYK